LLLFAGAGVDRLFGEWKVWRARPRAGAAAAALFGLGLLAWHDAYGVRHYRIPEISVNTGILERESGHFTAAVAYLRDGLRDRPDDSIARVHLALALEQAGDAQAALRAYLAGLDLAPDEADLTRMAGAFLARNQLDPTALELYRRAPDTEVRRRLAEAWLRQLAE
jgi:tetratricopeptide (TPR) repeat protein